MKAMKILFWAVSCLLAVMSNAAASNWNVPDDPGCETIAGALALAQPGDLVLVETGVYEEHDLVMPAGVTLRGFGPLTIVDAMGQGRVMQCIDLGADTAIENLVFRNGLADRGGALLCVNASPRIEFVGFHDCVADYGGAVHCSEGSAPYLWHCTFAANEAAYGGAVMSTGGSTPDLSRCLFAANAAEYAGGAVMLTGGSAAPLFGCTLVNNSAPVGAGISAWDGSASTMENTIVAYCWDSPIYGGDSGSLPGLACCDLYYNQPGVLYGQIGLDANFSADPQFCDQDNQFYLYYLIAETSPCAPGNAALCGQIGAFGVGCEGEVAIEPDGPPPVGEALPLATRLYPCRPNPFNPRTVLSFELHRPGRVELGVYDAKGRRVAALVDGPREAGAHEAVWEGRDDGGRAVPSGVYFATLITDTYRETRRMLLLK